MYEDVVRTYVKGEEEVGVSQHVCHSRCVTVGVSELWAALIRTYVFAAGATLP